MLRIRLLAATLVACVPALLAAGGARAEVPIVGASATRADVQRAAPLPRRALLGDALASTTPLRITVALKPRDGLAAFVAAVSDPGSPAYRHYLSVAQFRARFGAHGADAAAVRTTLRRSGLHVGAVAANGLAISATGTASRVARAFHTRLDHVALAGGRSAYADVVAPTLPTPVASLVQGIVGLDSLPLVRPEGLQRARLRPHASAQVGASSTGPATCGKAQTHGNTAQDIASAYGLATLWQGGDIGTGATVALYELEPFSPSDISAYKSCYGINTAVNVTTVDGGAGTAQQGEAALDVEDVAGLAPGATIDVYEGPNSGSGPYDVYQRIVSADVAKVVSTSWGDCEAAVGSAYAEEENTLFQEAATQGQTLYAASGDSGADDCRNGTAAVDDPASQPDVTGVGGTSLGSYLAPQNETVWNDGDGAGGGGVSTLWGAPRYQSALGATMREVPDVSADADPETGYAIYYKGAWGTAGGTSAAAPTWAALTALAERSSTTCSGYTHGFGLLNDALYALPAADFYDITSGDNTYGGVSGDSAGAGYDTASGLGAPKAPALASGLCAAGAGAPVNEPVVTAPPAGQTTTATTTTPTTGTTAAPVATTTTTPPTTTVTRGPAPATVVFSATAHRRAVVGASVRLSLRARDRRGLRLHYSAHGLPPGLRIDRRTGAVTGRPRRAGRFLVSVSAVDTAGNARSVVIRWTITSARRHPRR